MFENLELLQSIVSEFLRDYQRPLTYSDLARATGRNRQLITGALNTLQELGLVKGFTKGRTHKLFLLNLPFNYRSVVMKIRHLINFRDRGESDIRAILALEKLMQEDNRPPPPPLEMS